ncbi:general substrate transporter [Absidia repens]|uniref:General substrate transporter n=1 Tax=Absidia repens TaxID=90262 RepID=A0A1X2IBN0_9FUNG|nr:general substrate transporter [Absidia repens]
MTESRYALVVALLLAGGLVGACSASYFSDRYGRRPTLIYSNGILLAGSMMMAAAPTVAVLMLGRVLAGVGGGVATVVVPTYVAECVPKSRRGFFGTLNQLAIVVGILVSQIAGSVALENWRWILLLGSVLAALPMVLLPLCVESPTYLATASSENGDVVVDRRAKVKQTLGRLRGGVPLQQVEDELHELVTYQHPTSNSNNGDDGDDLTYNSNKSVSLQHFLVSPHYRHPLLLILLIQCTQQFSGINAVIFYSTSIMASVFPDSSDRITLSISIVNLLMTLVSASLMDRAGRRTLFLLSSCTMAFSSVILGWSLQQGHDRTAALAIVLFVAAFAIGLGPIPFLMIPELVDRFAAASAGSVGLAANMVCNFLVSAGFMALRDSLGQAHVFYLFALLLVLASLLALLYLPETKNKSPEQIVRSRWAAPPINVPWTKPTTYGQQLVHQYGLVPTSTNHFQ